MYEKKIAACKQMYGSFVTRKIGRVKTDVEKIEVLKYVISEMLRF